MIQGLPSPYNFRGQEPQLLPSSIRAAADIREALICKRREDMLTLDIYQVMAQYTGPALLFHGTDDPYVPPDYSRRAADILGAELIVVEGAGHGFTGGDMEQVARRSVDFVRDVLSAQSFSAAA